MARIAVGLLLACSFLVAPAEGADDWTQLFPSPTPPARGQHAMAYVGGDQVLMFGGWDGSSYHDDTWVHDVSEGTWTQMSPASKPSARYGHGLAYIGGDRALLFGGYQPGYWDDTWVYDLSTNTWTQMTPPSKPSARTLHGMAYIGDDQVLLFGGSSGSLYDETWVYDLGANTWTQMNPLSKPPKRNAHDAIAYVGGDRVLLFGGYSQGDYLDDTWVYDLSDGSWTELTSAPKPHARVRHCMAYIGDDQVLLFGGYDGLSYYYDTWVYDLSETTWTHDSNATRPSARCNHGLSETGMDGWSRTAMLFGPDDETWTYDGAIAPDPPQVLVRYPNGGETPNDTVTVTWIATDPDPEETALLLVDLDCSENAGDSWSAIDSNQTNDGAYFWDLSRVYGTTDYLIRITATDTSSLFGSDVSDSVFTVDNPIPRIVSVGDVPNDQGRQVAVLWDRSYLDAPGFQVITYYSVWRLYPYGEEIKYIYHEWDGAALDSLERIVYRTLPRGPGGDQADYWELIGTVDAHFFEEYAYIAPTLEDSSGSGIPYFTYLVSAHTADPYVFYDSAPDSGYSVDNTTPAPTTVAIRFQGGCAPGTIRLTWNQVTTGVDGTLELIPVDYRVYSSTDPNFDRPPGSLVTTTGDLTFSHTHALIGDPADNLYYYVTAVDGSDNESDASNAVGEFDWGAGTAATGKSSSQRQDIRIPEYR